MHLFENKKGIMVDLNFISKLEGGRTAKGYVPDPEGSRSGVTIATGVDLGQMGENDLSRLNLPPDLKDKLWPYFGRIKFEALSMLENMPLQITSAEAELIDKEVKSRFVRGLERKFNQAATTVFEELPDGVQTVIASATFQYGDLRSRTPNFWRQITTGDWQGAYQNLRNFGDSYSTRRNKEADLLKASLEESGLAIV
jgi:GH24 family phage-related lysozyme (muramidase)